ncbi:MAG: two-component system histidine kinase PnpS [Bacillota bacterium]
MFSSLRWRFIFTFFTITAVFLFLLGWFLMNSVENYTIQNIEKRLQADARLISQNVTESMRIGRNAEYYGQYAKEARQITGFRVTIIDAAGVVLGDSDVNAGEMENHKNRSEVQKSLAGEVGKSIRESLTLKQKMLYVAVPVKISGGVRGVVRLAVPWAEIQKGVNYIKAVIGAAILVAFILTFLVVSSLTPGIVAPLEEMTDVAGEMAEGKLDNEVRVVTNDELGALARSFNYMGFRLKETIGQITEERNKLQAILTSMADGVIAIDREGHILLINPTVEKMFNARMEDVMGKSVIEVIRNYDLEKLLLGALAGNDSYIREIQILSPMVKTFRVHLAPLKNASGTVGIVAVLRDITEIRELERMRTEFVANVSHELRTPLTSIKGFVETLLDGAIEDKMLARHFLDIVNEESNRLTRLIDDLLSLSRLEERNAEANKAPVEIDKVIGNIITMLNPQMKEKNLELETNIAGGMPVIQADRDMMGQLLINLLDNAIKYTPAGGRIKIEAAPAQQGIKVTVSDTGIGIPEESLPRLFERFYRVDKARSREMGGTGLGLAIVKHILELHGGSIEVSSELGRGTVFTFYLPA